MGKTPWQSPAKRATGDCRCTTAVGPLWQVHCRVMPLPSHASANAYPFNAIQIGGLGLLRVVQVPAKLEIHP